MKLPSKRTYCHLTRRLKQQEQAMQEKFAMLDGLAKYGGCDQWTEQSTEMVDSGLSGPPHGQEPRWLANAAVWAGGRPDDFRQERTKWTFGRRRG